VSQPSCNIVLVKSFCNVSAIFLCCMRNLSEISNREKINKSHLNNLITWLLVNSFFIWGLAIYSIVDTRGLFASHAPIYTSVITFSYSLSYALIRVSRNYGNKLKVLASLALICSYHIVYMVHLIHILVTRNFLLNYFNFSDVFKEWCIKLVQYTS